jgi:hypothetical protein
MTNEPWPELPLHLWRDTYATLHMWTQIVGKICLALTPKVNHYWNIAFQVSSRGLTTPAMPCGEQRTLNMTFDFISHELVAKCSDGAIRSIPLVPRTVAVFYEDTLRMLHELGVDVQIWTMPVEVPDPIRFELDNTHGSYDREYAHRFWQILVRVAPVMQAFRGEFLGKCSPVHFFWGGFDLAVTRFSGRPAPEHPGGVPHLPDRVAREAYSHEVSSCGFWPGNEALPEAAFYAYAYPEPDGFRNAELRLPAYYHSDLREFILPYDKVREALSPDALVLDFLQRTYEAAATLGRWNDVGRHPA